MKCRNQHASTVAERPSCLLFEIQKKKKSLCLVDFSASLELRKPSFIGTAEPAYLDQGPSGPGKNPDQEQEESAWAF